MEATKKYKIEKLGDWWHVLRLYYVGWWIFKKPIWLSEFPYYWHKENAFKKLKELNQF